MEDSWPFEDWTFCSKGSFITSPTQPLLLPYLEFFNRRQGGGGRGGPRKRPPAGRYPQYMKTQLWPTNFETQMLLAWEHHAQVAQRKPNLQEKGRVPPIPTNNTEICPSLPIPNAESQLIKELLITHDTRSLQSYQTNPLASAPDPVPSRPTASTVLHTPHRHASGQHLSEHQNFLISRTVPHLL